MQEAEINGSGLSDLADKISRKINIQIVAELPLVTIVRFIARIKVKSKDTRLISTKAKAFHLRREPLKSLLNIRIAELVL